MPLCCVHIYLQLLYLLFGLTLDYYVMSFFSLLLQSFFVRSIFWYKYYYYSQNYGFSSSHVWMWESDHKEGWVLKNWCFWIVVWEKILEGYLESKKIKPINPKGNQPWIFIGRLRMKLKLQYFGHLVRKVNTLEKTLMLGKIEGKRRGSQRLI